MVLFYLFLILLCIAVEQSKRQVKERFLIVVLIVLSLLAGFRSISSWSDTEVYVANFVYYTNSIFNFSFSDKPFGFSEPFFYYLGVFVKTFTDNYIVYLSFVAAVSLFILFLFFRQYCVYPLLGVCVYISRFLLGRNFIQIRAGLSYAILILGIKYITERNWKKYFFVVFIAYLFHRSAIIGIPLYFLCLFKFRKVHIVLLVLFSFVVGFFFSDTLQAFVVDNASDLEVTKYTVGDEIELAKGLSNPLIYFQCVILLFYTFGERRLRTLNIHYYTIRTAYLYSTSILIIFNNFVGLSGRTSSIFATLEVVIVPSLIFIFNKNNRFFAYLAMVTALSAIFYMNSL